jgi:hypothetical protein
MAVAIAEDSPRKTSADVKELEEVLQHSCRPKPVAEAHRSEVTELHRDLGEVHELDVVRRENVVDVERGGKVSIGRGEVDSRGRR